MTGSCVCLALVLMATPLADARAVPPLSKSSVGKAVRIKQLLLPGTELEARPLENRQSPIVLRIVDSFRHGTAYRYELEYYGLRPGRYDLRDFVQRKDRSATADLPNLPVEIVALLPAGQILPHELTARRLPWLGGYRALLVGGALVWLAGLAAILLVRRHRHEQPAAQQEVRVSLADQLRPLVDAAVKGTLSSEQQAQLDRLMLGYWRRRVGLVDLEPADALVKLRDHEQAGALLRQVELWLHAPPGSQSVDVAALLAPYRDLPPEDTEMPWPLGAARQEPSEGPGASLVVRGER